MPLLVEVPPLYSYIVLGLVVVFRLPWLGHAVLAFMRDLDDYRRNRPRTEPPAKPPASPKRRA